MGITDDVKKGAHDAADKLKGKAEVTKDKSEALGYKAKGEMKSKKADLKDKLN